MVAYLRIVGVEGGDLWGGIGFILGPLLIAYADARTAAADGGGSNRDAMTGYGSLLPYFGFLGIAVLFAFHVLIGQPLSPFVGRRGRRRWSCSSPPDRWSRCALSIC